MDLTLEQRIELLERLIEEISFYDFDYPHQLSLYRKLRNVRENFEDEIEKLSKTKS